MKMSVKLATAALTMAAVIASPVLAQQPANRNVPSEDGVALAIVYDTSGSMRDQVPSGAGGRSPKYVIANRALAAVIDRLQAVARTAPANAPRKIEAGLFVFKGNHANVAIPFGPFNPEALRSWVNSFSTPDGSTPLGDAVQMAAQAVLKSKLSRKHVLVVTDGMNTAGPDPAAILPRLKEEAARKSASVAYHFVAFDVAAREFEAVKRLGATVVGAADEKQLNTQLDFILEKKILLEDEEAPAKPPKKN